MFYDLCLLSGKERKPAEYQSFLVGGRENRVKVYKGKMS